MNTLISAFLAVGLLLAAASAGPAPQVALVKVNGTINPATAGYIARCIELAATDRAQCIVIQLDTPGGLLDSTKEIVQSFYASPIPIVVYVGPSGANATSAGCFITLASDVAAMAPNTSIGAAHPVSIGGGDDAEKPDDTMKQKLENFTASYIETIAQKRGRNAAWARSAVLESANITSEVALETKVIDLIAADIPDLLRQLDGRSVRDIALKTDGAEIREIDMTPSERIFHVFWRPEVLMILMLVAVYGIIAEVSNPGAIIPGVVGVVALILALYMSAALPVNVAGVALITLAIGLFVAEAFTPTFGVLLGSGAIAFFFGLMLLFDRADPTFHLSFYYIVPATLITVAFFAFVVTAGLRAQSLPVRAGRETMIGMVGEATSDITPLSGKVFIDGAYWNAASDAPIRTGQRVEIVALDGLTLKVKPHESSFPDTNPNTSP